MTKDDQIKGMAQPQRGSVGIQEARTDFDVRGILAAKLKCWHRLTEAESDELVKLFIDHFPDAGERKPLITREQHFALREAFAINAADSYFEANPTHDNDVGRMLFERGFARGFDSHERAIEAAHNIKEGS